MKNLVLTPKGRKLREKLPETVWSGPNTFSALTAKERAQLIQLVTALTAGGSESDDAE